MKMIDDIRRENLARLRDAYGSHAAFAAHLVRSESQVSQWIHGSINSGTGKPRSMRTATARWIEQMCGKPVGWLDVDHTAQTSGELYPSANVQPAARAVESNVVTYKSWPFKRIDPERFAALPLEEQAVIEGRLIEAIKDAEARIGKRSASGRH